MQFQRKLTNQTWENGKKPNFGPDFGPFGSPNFFSWILPLLDIRYCCKVSLYAISKKTYQPSLRKCQKKPSWAQLWPIWSKFGPTILASLVTRHRGQLSSCTISKKTNDSILIKLSDRRTAGRTNREQTNQSDFIGRCPSDVKRPKVRRNSRVSSIIHCCIYKI